MLEKYKLLYALPSIIRPIYVKKRRKVSSPSLFHWNGNRDVRPGFQARNPDARNDSIYLQETGPCIKASHFYGKLHEFCFNLDGRETCSALKQSETETGLVMKNLKSTLVFVLFFPAALVLSAQPALAADNTVAEITSMDGTVHLDRLPGENRLTVGFRLKPGDILETGADGSLGLVFDDDTRLSMGPDSRLKIESFVFDPGESEFSFIVRMFKGTAVYISGLIAKMSAKATTFITPTASIGIRGTRFAVHVEEIKS